MKEQFAVLNEAVECDAVYMRIDSAYEGGEYAKASFEYDISTFCGLEPE